MNKTMNWMVLMLLVTATSLAGNIATAEEAGEAKKAAPKVQIAILLDNSGSMGGLINQARSELWKIVNEFATSKQDGVAPELEVAVYHYGNPPATKLVGLTDDLDSVSAALFGIPVNGGSEFCGAVIQSATNDLEWSKNDRDLKLIFIAGNEPFSQGPVDYKEACKEAIKKGVIVNTIHCGSGIPDGWKQGAMMADGNSINIDQNQAVVNIPAPQDKAIVELGVKLNKTYIAFGSRGKEGAKEQVAQDGNSAGASLQSAQSRAVTKASRFYKNSSWDLCDAYSDKKVDLEKIDESQLPENMWKMTAEQRKTYVTKMQKDREEIQKKINDLNAERTKYVSAKRKELATKDSKKTLDAALIESIHKQATKKNFTFGK